MAACGGASAATVNTNGAVSPRLPAVSVATPVNKMVLPGGMSAGAEIVNVAVATAEGATDVCRSSVMAPLAFMPNAATATSSAARTTTTTAPPWTI